MRRVSLKQDDDDDDVDDDDDDDDDDILCFEIPRSTTQIWIAQVHLEKAYCKMFRKREKKKKKKKKKKEIKQSTPQKLVKTGIIDFSYNACYSCFQPFQYLHRMHVV